MLLTNFANEVPQEREPHFAIGHRAARASQNSFSITVSRKVKIQACIIQAGRAKTRCDVLYGRAESKFSRFFLLYAAVGREIRPALNVSRSFRTVCLIFAPRNARSGSEAEIQTDPLP